MLEAHEWQVIAQAAGAGQAYRAVYEEARSLAGGRAVPECRTRYDPAGDYLRVGYELFTGIPESDTRRAAHHRLGLYGPACGNCGKPLRTPVARVCAACGAPRPGFVGENESLACRYPLRKPLTLARVLESPSGASVLHALTWLARRHGERGELDSLPEEIKLIFVLEAFVRLVSVEGAWKFIDTGDYWQEVRFAERWCERIGAMRVAAYLRAIQESFPAAKIPTDPRARARATSEIENRLNEVDRAFRNVLDDVAPALRRFIAANRAKFEDLLRPQQPQIWQSGDAWDAEILEPLDPIAAYWSMVMLGQALPTKKLPGVEVGDLIELTTPAGIAYLQVTHSSKLRPVWGPVVRVIPGIFSSPLDSMDLAKHATVPTWYFTVFDVDEALASGEVTARGKFEIPAEDRQFPAFRAFYGRRRDGRAVWSVWTGGEGETDRLVGPLDDDERRMPLLDMPRAAELASRIAGGWSPARDAVD